VILAFGFVGALKSVFDDLLGFIRIKFEKR
jgi:hypothetical protein